jgi:hypothetical protein
MSCGNGLVSRATVLARRFSYRNAGTSTSDEGHQEYCVFAVTYCYQMQFSNMVGTRGDDGGFVDRRWVRAPPTRSVGAVRRDRHDSLTGDGMMRSNVLQYCASRNHAKDVIQIL